MLNGIRLASPGRGMNGDLKLGDFRRFDHAKFTHHRFGHQSRRVQIRELRLLVVFGGVEILKQPGRYFANHVEWLKTMVFFMLKPTAGVDSSSCKLWKIRDDSRRRAGSWVRLRDRIQLHNDIKMISNYLKFSRQRCFTLGIFMYSCKRRYTTSKFQIIPKS